MAKSQFFRPILALMLLPAFTTQPALSAQEKPPASAPAPIETLSVGEVMFYGYDGLDLDAIRTALPIHIGDDVPIAQWPAKRAGIEQAVKRITGHAPTDVATVCCDDHGKWLVYIGLPGRSNRSFPYNPQPRGQETLPMSVLTLYKQALDELLPAIQHGEGTEDQGVSYSLVKYPPMREKQLAMRKYAIEHEEQLRAVLASASQPEQRQAAAEILGYAEPSNRQIAALVAASRDPDDGVRNNAVRALAVMARSNEKLARRIPASGMIAMVDSGSWTDRNKATFLLTWLTASRDPKLLKALKEQCGPSLIEMAQWDTGHADAARLILGRIAGMPDARIIQLSHDGQVGTIVAAVQGMR